jgi:hypothetical protein
MGYAAFASRERIHVGQRGCARFAIIVSLQHQRPSAQMAFPPYATGIGQLIGARTPRQARGPELVERASAVPHAMRSVAQRDFREDAAPDLHPVRARRTDFRVVIIQQIMSHNREFDVARHLNSNPHIQV